MEDLADAKAYVTKLKSFDPAMLTLEQAKEINDTMGHFGYMKEDLKIVNEAIAHMWSWCRSVQKYVVARYHLEMPPPKPMQHALYATKPTTTTETPASAPKQAAPIPRPAGAPAFISTVDVTAAMLSELHSFRHPPRVVEDVMACMQMILGHKTTWIATMEDLADVKAYLAKLKSFDPAMLTLEQAKEINDSMGRCGFTKEDLQSVNVSAATMWAWCQEVQKYMCDLHHLEMPKAKPMHHDRPHCTEATTAPKTA
jgi:hypothetical protein